MKDVQKILLLGALISCTGAVQGAVPAGHAVDSSSVQESKEPSISASVAIKNSLVIPLAMMYEKDKDPLINKLQEIAHDLYKLAHKKVAIKFVDYIKSRKSFEEGLLNSDFPGIYIRIWKQEIEKRLRKIEEYRERLAKITQRLTAYNSELSEVQKSKNHIYQSLTDHATQVQSAITMVTEWLKRSDSLFKEELIMIKQRQDSFRKGGVLGS